MTQNSSIRQGLVKDFPIKYILYDDRLLKPSSHRECKVIIMDSGDGWLYTDRGELAVTFLMEDILYRLDLQNKST